MTYTENKMPLADESILVNNAAQDGGKANKVVSHSVGIWMRKYFCEGQMLQDGVTKAKNRRKFFAMCIPIVVVWAVWWPYMLITDNWSLFTETDNGSSNNEPRWVMSVTMVFGSMIAGGTSEGGAAIAFPVMILVLGIEPTVARDFSLMIQTIGMVAASFTIMMMRVKVEVNSLRYTTAGGLTGVVLGLELVSPALSPPFTKMIFVGWTTAFAFSLYFLNRNSERETHSTITKWALTSTACRFQKCGTLAPTLSWKSLTLVVTGVVGGIFTGIAGSGIDICSFAILTLLFRVTEKVATPTSVVLMAINTTFGFAYTQFVMGGVEHDAWGFWIVCIPIVVVGAPLGSLIGTHFHRLTLAAFIYIIDTILLIGALVVVKPWLSKANGGKTDNPTALCITTSAVMLSGVLFFHWLTHKGLSLLQSEENRAMDHDENQDTFCGTDDHVGNETIFVEVNI